MTLQRISPEDAEKVGDLVRAYERLLISVASHTGTAMRAYSVSHTGEEFVAVIKRRGSWQVQYIVTAFGVVTRRPLADAPLEARERFLRAAPAFVDAYRMLLMARERARPDAIAAGAAGLRILRAMLGLPEKEETDRW